MELAHETFLAEIGDRSIVLDLQRDRYFGLGTELTAAARMAASTDRDEQKRQAAINLLIGRGVLRKGAIENSTGGRSIAPVTLSSTLWPTRRFGLGFGAGTPLTVSVLTALAQTRYSFARRTFLETILWLRSARSDCRDREHSRSLSEIVDSYFAARPWFPTPPICRIDAPALSLHLWRNGHKAELVFGVRIVPFKAHCWVQQGAVALSEPADRLRQFTPLMTI